MKTLLIALAVLVAACHPIPPSPPDPGDDCGRAYEHLGAVGCEPSRPESGTWVDVCRNARRNGLMALGCINRAATFAAADACGVNCAPK
jgi:hypothetical protein